MCWFTAHLWQAVSMSHVCRSCYLWVCFHAVLQKHVSSARGADSCKVSDAGKSPLPLQRLTLRPTDVSLQGINEKYSSFGSERCRCPGTEELIYCSLSTTVLLVSLALVWKLLKVSEKSPRGCRLPLIGGAVGGLQVLVPLLVRTWSRSNSDSAVAIINNSNIYLKNSSLLTCTVALVLKDIKPSSDLV